jgi:MoxR-like ATPase
MNSELSTIPDAGRRALPALPTDDLDLPLPECKDGGLEAGHHVLTRREAVGILAALAAGRPLLLRGEPGVGKTQLARAAAVWLGRAFVHQTVDAQTEPTALLWRLDAVRRLADAQLLAQVGLTRDALRTELALGNYLQPGALWWAFDWEGAQAQAATAEGGPAACGHAGSAAGGVVALVDEIDKAESSVPNGLLAALAGGSFTRPDQTVVSRGGSNPLVIIATNEERPMPEAFLRRCLVLHLALPEPRGELIDYLLRRSGRVEGVSPAVQRAVAELIADARGKASPGAPREGLAEHLDLLRALGGLVPGDDAAQLRLLGELKSLALDKRRGLGA